MENQKTRQKKKLELWQKILLIVGIIVAVLAVAAIGAFLYFRSVFMGSTPRVTIGEPVDEAVVSTTGGDIRGYISNGVYTYHGRVFCSLGG